MNMETGGFGGDDRRRLLVPALIVVAALVVLLLIIGIASAIRGRGSAAPTATIAAVATTRPPIVAGSATVATRTVTASNSPRPSTSPGVSAAPSAAPSTAPSTGTAYVIANTGGDNLNLRRTPSTGAEIVARLAEGDRVTEIGPAQTVEGRQWRNIRTSDGIDGWVASEFTQVAP